jgi:outer membrane protein OmpA-like peptidoglycan-associated protein
MRLRSILVALPALLLCTVRATIARAQEGPAAERVTETIRPEASGTPMLELGVSGGAFFPSKSHALNDEGNSTAMPAQTASFDMNLHLAVFPIEWVGAEIEGGFSPIRASTGEEAKVLLLRGHLILQYPGRVTPFLLGGVGFVGSLATKSGGADLDRASHLGAGIKFDITNWVMARFEVRDVIDGVYAPSGHSVTMNFEAFAGISIPLFRREADDSKEIALIEAPPPREAPPPPEPAPVEAAAPMTVVEEVKSELDRVHFEWGRFYLAATDMPALERASVLLLKHPEISIVIDGHTDSTGPLEYNMWLSRKRAQVLKSFLVKKGVPPERLTVLGFGPLLPADTNATLEGRAANRRGVVKVKSSEEDREVGSPSAP